MSLDKDPIVLSKTHEKITHLYHISDVHINLQKRHNEFREVFERLYKQIRVFKDQKENGLIILTGDILNSKNIMTPELIVLVQELFSQLSQIYPVILIAGNHDAILTNNDRLDSLTPLIFSQAQPFRKLSTYRSDKYRDMFYLRETGLYQYNNLIFSVASVFDQKVIPVSQITTDSCQLKIALHHGTLDGAKTDLGHILQSHLTIKDFIGYDAVLLGDIHKYQSLDAEKRIFYAGSLIQLNHGESLHNHGLLKWDLTTMATQFYEIPNDYGFCTIVVKKNQIIAQPSKMPMKPRIRYRIDQFTDEKVFAEIKNKYRLTYQVQEEIVDNMSIWGEPSTSDSSTEIGLHMDQNQPSQLAIDILNPEIQKQLITDHFNSQSIDPIDIKKLLDLNAQLNDEAIEHNRTDNESAVIHVSNSQIKWKIKRLSFSNMFNYGDDNIIDFTQFNQICGIFGENAIGKSSILDIILFVLFDKCSRGDRTEVLNLKKSQFFCELLFDIGNHSYRIQRNGQQYTKTTNGKKKTSVRIDVVFEQIIGESAKVNLSGQDRNETNRKIRELIGTYDDFLMSTFLLQDDTDKFLKMSQVDRKSRLYDLFKLNWFEKLYILAKSHMDGHNHQIKALEKLQINDDFAKFNAELQSLSSQLVNIGQEMTQYETEHSQIDQLIDSMKIKISPLLHFNLSENEAQEQLEMITKEKVSLQTLCQQFNDSNLGLVNKDQLRIDQIDCEAQIGVIKSNLDNYQEKLIQLKNYDDNKYFNIVTDLEHEIEKNTQLIRENEKQSSELTQKLEQIPVNDNNLTIEQLYQKKNHIKKNMDEVNAEITQLQRDKNHIKNPKLTIADLERNIQSVNDQINQLTNLISHQKDLGKTYINQQEQLEKELLIYQDLIEDQVVKNKTHNEIKYQIKNIKSSSEKLIKLKYDPQCGYCTNNVFVIEAKQCQEQLHDLIVNFEKIKEEIADIEGKITKMNTPNQLTQLSDSIKNNNLEIKNNQQKIDKFKDQLQSFEEDLSNLIINQSIDKNLVQLDSTLLNMKNQSFEIDELIQKRNLLDIETNQLKDLITNLLLQKINLQASIDHHQKTLKDLNQNHVDHLKNTEIRSLIAIENQKLKEFSNKRLEIVKIEQQMIEHERNLLKRDKYQSDLSLLEKQSQDLQKDLETHQQNLHITEKNLQFEVQIKNMNLDKGRINVNIYVLQKKKEQLIIKKTIAETKIKQLNEQIDQLRTLKDNVKIYQLYCQCLGKNGLPYELLMKIINHVTEISNNILKQIADFTIQFLDDADHKKLSLLLHRGGSTQSVELCSGFEKFIIELSLKIAFSMVSNVARPNFLAIDEGFGCLDSDHLSSLISILNFIKTKFEFIIIITHVTELKGQGDSSLDIQRLKNGNSQINNSKKITQSNALPILNIKSSLPIVLKTGPKITLKLNHKPQNA